LALQRPSRARRGRRDADHAGHRGESSGVSPALLAEARPGLADRYYASFWDFALLDQRNVRLVTRQHQLRTTDFRRGTRLGEGDHLVTWAKPKQRPDWMDRETYQRLPAELVLREVRVRVQQRGFRVREYVLVSTADGCEPLFWTQTRARRLLMATTVPPRAKRPLRQSERPWCCWTNSGRGFQRFGDRN
jgi:hypothetical protein